MGRARPWFLPIGLQTFVGPHIDALFPAGENLAPSLAGSAALPVEEELGALGLGAEKGDLGEGAVPAPLAAGGKRLDPVFQLGERKIQTCAVNFFKKTAGGFKKRSFGGKYKMMEKPHEPVSPIFPRMDAIEIGNIGVQAGS